MGKHKSAMSDDLNLNSDKDSICGLYAGRDGTVALCLGGADGSRRTLSTTFEPFLWTCADSDAADFGGTLRPLSGPETAPLNRLAAFHSPDAIEAFLSKRNKSIPVQTVRGLENQYLISNGARMFANMPFGKIRRLQLDIEVYAERGFPRAEIDADRIIAVGLSGIGGEKILEISDMDADSERDLLERLQKEIIKRDPDIIEGHNIFKFDLQYIRRRCSKVGAAMDWGRFGAPVKFRQSRLNFAERAVSYTRCDIPGRTVIDTFHLVQLYDIGAREMESYSLKYAAVYFGISDETERTYIRGDAIKDAFFNDRKTFRAYLSDDLRETAGLSEKLLPTYVAQVGNFPLTLQDCVLRGTGVKVESILLEKYLCAQAALPIPTEGEYFEGALSKSYRTGLFRKVLHYDVASLYPSLLLHIGRCPKNDYLETFLEALSKLRSMRLEYKRLARQCKVFELQKEYEARQQSFKILINSFYGYLGLNGAVFADTGLADEVTRTGRELLTKLMDAFSEAGCEVLEADTDGIYVAGGKYFEFPEKLLEKISAILPYGIDLEFDGAYDSMLCYKAKNYALLEGDKIVLKGSAFRSRSTEPFLRSLTRKLIECLLKANPEPISKKIDLIRKAISDGSAPVSELAKCEFIGKSCSQYENEIKKGECPRRAAMEAALAMNPRPEVGDRVCYYISAAPPKTPDWKRAKPLEEGGKTPYDPGYYLSKLDDWQKRFSDIAPFLKKQGCVQSEFDF